MSRVRQALFLFPVILLLAGCGVPAKTVEPAQALAVESFLADITRNVAGDRMTVDSLIPEGLDPHAFDPTPQDVARISQSQVLIINGAGLEGWLQPVLENAGGERLVIEACAGLEARPHVDNEASDEHTGEIDPHFWLDPISVVRYVENIRDGLSQVDPANASAYAQNAESYIAQLRELDGWIRQQIETIPPERRLLVTNHESFGYYADRYGLKVIGAIITSASSNAAPSAQELARLAEAIRATGAPAIFLETGTNQQLAEQLAVETGIRVVTGLQTHSLALPGSSEADYIHMMRYNTEKIVQALQ
ncbi:MAG TPA: metal ABC transporter substrate-binding protein [Anaerolineaceae bacterium]